MQRNVRFKLINFKACDQIGHLIPTGRVNNSVGFTGGHMLCSLTSSSSQPPWAELICLGGGSGQSHGGWEFSGLPLSFWCWSGLQGKDVIIFFAFFQLQTQPFMFGVFLNVGLTWWRNAFVSRKCKTYHIWTSIPFAYPSLLVRHHTVCLELAFNENELQTSPAST